MPNITNDMDGIFGGKNLDANVREFQWKTFTPMQLNMDGWGSNPKYPQALGEPATSINRTYLKLKSMLLPYTYTFAHEAITGKPLIRAMFLDEANAYTLGRRTQYQFLYGPSILVAPIYEKSDVRNGIYLPQGTWYDYFTGQAYRGGQVLNAFDAPQWKLPVFVREGAIIPMNNASNNPTPFTVNIDMHATTVLDRLQYVPRDNAGNGTLLEGAISLSRDGRTWSQPQPFRFRQDNLPKTIDLTNEDVRKMNEEGVRYLRLDVVRSVGDVNQNGLIDAQDISNVATMLEGGAGRPPVIPEPTYHYVKVSSTHGTDEFHTWN